jgi:hypothetical protein
MLFLIFCQVDEIAPVEAQCFAKGELRGSLKTWQTSLRFLPAINHGTSPVKLLKLMAVSTFDGEFGIAETGLVHREAM